MCEIPLPLEFNVGQGCTNTGFAQTGFYFAAAFHLEFSSTLNLGGGGPRRTRTHLYATGFYFANTGSWKIVFPTLLGEKENACVPSVRETYTGLLFWIRFQLFPTLLGERGTRAVAQEA